MNKIKSRIGRLGRLLARRSTLLACLLAGIVVAGCSDDLGQGMGHDDMGKKVYGKLSVNLGVPSSEVLSRSVDFSEDALIKIDSYWLGVYDTQTGELIGSKYDIEPRKKDGTRYTMNGPSTYEVEDVDIYYYDSHPEFYIVGVINFNGVLGKMAGEASTTPLLELLTNAEKFEDFTRISVDVASANRANPAESSGLSPMPLMMGYYTTSNTTLHTTINSNGSLNQDNAKIRVNPGVEGVALPEGSIRLQRLMAEINVNVSAREGVTIRSIEYRVYNNPTEVYLAEHTTDGAGSIRTTKADYDANTANSADMVENGYNSYGGFSRAYKTGENSYFFSYQEYENKHWGRTRTYPDGDPTSHITREQKFDVTQGPEDAVFMSLNNDASKPYNNNASFIVIKADIDTKETENYGKESLETSHSGTVTYIIHEGCASNIDGSANRNGFDYQRNRNTRYNYNITINGIEDLFVNVDAKDYYSKHNDGIGGEAWETVILECDPESIESFTITLYSPEELDMLTYRVWQKTPDGEVNYGNWKASDNAPSTFPAWPEMPTRNLDNELPLNSYLNYLNHVFYMPNYPSEEGEKIIYLSQLNSRDNPDIQYPAIFKIEQFPLTIQDADLLNFPEFKMGVYIGLNDVKTDADGCSVTQRVVGLERVPRDTRMTPPQLTVGGMMGEHHQNPGGKWCTANNVVCYMCWYYPINYYTEYYILEVEGDPNVHYIDAVQYSDADGHGPTHYPYEVPADMEPGFHTIKITPVVNEMLYKPAEPVVFENVLYVGRDSYWNFSYMPEMIEWIESTSSYNNNLFTGYIEYDGLIVCGSYGSTNDNGLTLGTSDGVQYFQTGGSGNENYRSFKVRVAQPGTFTVFASSSTGDPVSGRYLNLSQGGEVVDRKEVTVPNTEKNTPFYLYTDDVDEPTEMSIYTTGNLRIYAIQFTPRGRVPVVPLPPVVP